MTAPSTTTHYVYDRAGRLLAEASGTGTIQREYVWLDDTPVAVFADLDTGTPKQWYIHPDHLDRPVRMTDAAKTVVWDAWFWPYGEVRSITGSATLNLRFPGQYFLPESGLHTNWHRHYDPTLGRYIQPDPNAEVIATQPVNLDGTLLTARGGAGNSPGSGGSRLPLSIASSGDTNRQIGAELPEFVDGPSVYQYARSMPAMYTDPEGLQSAKQKVEAIINLCLWAIGQLTGNPDVRARPGRPLPEFTKPVQPTKPSKSPIPMMPKQPTSSGPSPPPPDLPTPPVSR